MAYIIGTKRPEAETGQPQQLVAGQPSMIGTQATTGFQAQSGGAPQSTFTNLQRYIEANQGNVGGLVSAIGSQKEKTEQPFQAEKQRAEEAAKQATEALAQRGQTAKTVESTLGRAQTLRPEAISQEEIQNIRNLATSYNYDPTRFATPITQSTASLRQQLGESGAVRRGLENLQTATGQRQALLAERQAPRSSLGGLELDTFLLGATPGAREQIQNMFTGRVGQLEQAITPLEATQKQIQESQGLSAQDIQSQLSNLLSGYTTNISSQLPSLIEERAKSNLDFAKNLQARQTLESQLAEKQKALGELKAPTAIQDVQQSSQTAQQGFMEGLQGAGQFVSDVLATGLGQRPATPPPQPTQALTATGKYEADKRALESEIAKLQGQIAPLSDLEKRLESEKAGITYGQALTPEMKARYSLYSQLAGLSPDVFLGRTL